MTRPPGPPRVLFAGGGTGGHLYPALALARAFEEAFGAHTFFLGARRGVEAKVLPERGVPHRLLPFEPLRRSRPWQNWRLLPGLSRAFAGIARTFREFHPDLVVGTGGYASGPTVAWAVLRGVPSAIQEQNSYPGLTTRWLAARVGQVHLAFPEARSYLRTGARTEIFELGNPIQPPAPTIDPADARGTLGLGPGPMALVVGGSQGARAINEALLADLGAVVRGELAARPPGLELLWATGPSHYERVSTEVKALGTEAWVHARPYLHEMPRALAAADLAVSRAGAMALAELCAWGVASVLIPFPYAAADHQLHNARALQEAGAAVVVTEPELHPGRLWLELVGLAEDDQRRQRIAARARERGNPDAAREIVAELARLLEPATGGSPPRSEGAEGVREAEPGV